MIRFKLDWKQYSQTFLLILFFETPDKTGHVRVERSYHHSLSEMEKCHLQELTKQHKDIFVTWAPTHDERDFLTELLLLTERINKLPLHKKERVFYMLNPLINHSLFKHINNTVGIEIPLTSTGLEYIRRVLHLAKEGCCIRLELNPRNKVSSS